MHCKLNLNPLQILQKCKELTKDKKGALLLYSLSTTEQIVSSEANQRMALTIEC